jgi:hypothetical protein
MKIGGRKSQIVDRPLYQQSLAPTVFIVPRFLPVNITHHTSGYGKLLTNWEAQANEDPPQ